jgi:hypothetical protein
MPRTDVLIYELACELLKHYELGPRRWDGVTQMHQMTPPLQLDLITDLAADVISYSYGEWEGNGSTIRANRLSLIKVTVKVVVKVEVRVEVKDCKQPDDFGTNGGLSVSSSVSSFGSLFSYCPRRGEEDT